MDEQISRSDETDRWEINAVGLEEEILCEMCENPMHTDRGCDGLCSYDKDLYKRIIKVLNDRMKPLQPDVPVINVGDMISRQAVIDLLKQMRKDGDMVPWEGKNVFARIRKLPSAQPDVPEMNVRDMISKQVAMERLMAQNVIMEGSEYHNGFNAGVNRAQEVIRNLPTVQTEIIHCKDCKHWIPYDWMFSEVWQSQNMADYPEDEIGCNYCDIAMKANDFCSRAEKRGEADGQN